MPRPAAADADPRLFDDGSADRAALEARYLRLVRVELPALAASRDWPIRLDHCFMRVVLDHVFAAPWPDRLTGRPAYRHLTGDELRRAVALAESIRDGDDDVLRSMNARSLLWRRACVTA